MEEGNWTLYTGRELPEHHSPPGLVLVEVGGGGWRSPGARCRWRASVQAVFSSAVVVYNDGWIVFF